METKDKYITQKELADLTGKKRQWINYLVSLGRLNSIKILGKKVIIRDQKVENFLKETK